MKAVHGIAAVYTYVAVFVLFVRKRHFYVLESAQCKKLNKKMVVKPFKDQRTPQSAKIVTFKELAAQVKHQVPKKRVFNAAERIFAAQPVRTQQQKTKLHQNRQCDDYQAAA